MLLDRGLLVQEGSAYRVTGEVDALEVPETLHALIAARLDGLSAEERRLLQDAAVLGKTFTQDALAALADSDAEIEPLLTALARKEVLGVQTDPRSPEHGQYGFLQDLVRHVAYETLSKRERRTRHLAAAEHLTAAFAGEEDEVVEVIAFHYVAAYEIAPEADDAAEIKQKAQAMLTRAGERAASLGAAAEAQRYFEQAAGLTDEPLRKAALLDRAGLLATYAAQPEAATGLLEESIALYEAEGDTHAAARVSSTLAWVESSTGEVDRALERMERAFAVISTDEPDEDQALLAARLAGGYAFVGDLERASERAELALDISESLGLPEALTRAFNAKGLIAAARGHPQEAVAFMAQALAIALAHDLPERASHMYLNLSAMSYERDRYADALGYLQPALELARRLGDRPREWTLLAELTYPLYMTGRWEEALAGLEDLTEEQMRSGAMFLSVLTSVLEIHIHRGELEQAQRLYSLFSRLETSADLQEQGMYRSATAALRRGEGRFGEALEAGAATVELARTFSAGHQLVKQGLVEAIEAALALGERERAGELLATIEKLPPGLRPPYLEAQAHRFRARLDGNEAGYRAAAARFRDLEIPFWLGVTLLEHGEEPGLAEAREIFERLEARPWLERLDAVAPVRAEVTA
jgi:tetratricopeptide (TPR) repeat protein